jgi:hypothetical protein
MVQQKVTLLWDVEWLEKWRLIGVLACLANSGAKDDRHGTS